MSDKYANLREAAIAARDHSESIGKNGWLSTGVSMLIAHDDDVRFIGSASPDVVLALLDEIDALRADAERYRWLRQQPNDTTVPRIDVIQWEELDESANGGTGLRLEELDAAIDAARGGE